jgi:uncharacterized protein (TIGR02145 family)
MKRILTILCLVLVAAIKLHAQNLMIVHQGNGTQLQIPLESIDSVRFVLVPPPILQKIYQNNGNILSIAISDIDSITYTLPDEQQLAQITTLPVTVLSATSAYGGGTISANGGSQVTQRGVCWSTSSNPTLANNFTIDGSGNGSFGSNILPLQPATTYYVRAYAVNAEGTAYGNEQIFTTQNASGAGVLPTVSTNNVVYTDGLTATCGGNITADGGLVVTARGVCWAIGTTPTINNNITVNGNGGGSFSSTLTNLLPGTSYFVRAYATNDAGTAYGIAYSFTTLGMPTIETSEAVAITHFSALVGAVNVNAQESAIIDKGICWSTSPNPVVYQNAMVSAGNASGDFKKSVQGLALNTTYFARAYIITNVGIVYGNTVSFTTLAADQFNPNISYGSVNDADGNTYRTVAIGNREWFAENLRSSRFADGSLIPELIQDSVNGNPIEYPTWCSINFNEHYDNPWGKLYNSYSITDDRNVCPAGWRVSEVVDWNILFEGLDSTYYNIRNAWYLSGGSAFGVRNKLRSANLGYWNDLDSTNNVSGFSIISGVKFYVQPNWADGFLGIDNDGNVTMGRSEFINSQVCSNCVYSSLWISFIEDIYNSFFPYPDDFEGLFPVRCVRSLDSLPFAGFYISPDNIGCYSYGFVGWVDELNSSNFTTIGFCFDTELNPTIESNLKSESNSVYLGGMSFTGYEFSASVYGFQANTQYYGRAFATNDYGTYYGNNFTFSTSNDSLVVKIDSANFDNSGLLHVYGLANFFGSCYDVSAGCNSISDKGICWSSSPNPTVADTMLSSGPGCATSLEQVIGGLNQGATYYFRAYAFVSPDSVTYSNELVLTVPIDPAAVHTCGAIAVHNPNLTYGSLTDQEGNVYKTIVIGTQEWMAENLKTSIYNNGDSIAHVTDGWEWQGLSSGAWCHYNNDSQYECPYGKLYNWYAVADPRNVCPSGWHVPSDDEWSTLTNFLGGTNPAWSKLKSTGTLYWFDSNGYIPNSTNESGFSALPGGSGGWYFGGDSFYQLSALGSWWSSTEVDINTAWSRSIGYMLENVNQDYSNKNQGLSIRCLKD